MTTAKIIAFFVFLFCCWADMVFFICYINKKLK